jgi:molybdate transport system substrate-binding protein
MKLTITKAIAVAALLFAAPLSAHAATIRVFAAASLTESFKEIGAAYQAAHPGDTVEFNFAGTPTLKTQIEQGAPADVFASADKATMSDLGKESLTSPSKTFAHNKLIIVAPPKSKRVSRITDIAMAGVNLVLAGETVPAGRYALQSINKMGTEYGSDFVIKTGLNIVSHETDVKAVLAKVQLGEADAGFVYATDAKAAGDKVKTVNIPDKFNVIAEYPIALVTRTPNETAATGFVQFVLGPDGQAILRKYGFQK